MQNYHPTRHLHGTEKSITYYFINCTLLPITLSVVLYYLLLYQLFHYSLAAEWAFEYQLNGTGAV